MNPKVRKVVRTLSPRVVSIETESIPNLGFHDVLVDTLCTSVSNGTELLVYRGEVPGNVTTDSSLKHLQSSFKYPIAYGYSSVGRISRVGDCVTKWKDGDVVFGFREHASMFVSNEDDLLRVPKEISAKNACFLPAMETAVSIAFDAALLPGESALVVGQGIIGLLVVATLKALYPYSKVRAVEKCRTRRSLSTADTVLTVEEALKCETELNANKNISENGADVAIDTSGTSEGLDIAISLTRDSGRVVVASWFGNKDVSLKSLGGRIHRSHITLVISQVSEIPMPLRARWTKERRFQLAWQILKSVQPVNILNAKTVDVHEAPDVMRQIDDGNPLQVIYEYGNI